MGLDILSNLKMTAKWDIALRSTPPFSVSQTAKQNKKSLFLSPQLDLCLTPDKQWMVSKELFVSNQSKRGSNKSPGGYTRYGSINNSLYLIPDLWVLVVGEAPLPATRPVLAVYGGC